MDEATIHAISDLIEELIAAGATLLACGLGAPSEAKSLRGQPNGEVLIADGPYLEAKEHLGGFEYWKPLTWTKRWRGPQGFSRPKLAGRDTRNPIQQPAERHSSPIAPTPATAMSTPIGETRPPLTSTMAYSNQPPIQPPA